MKNEVRIIVNKIRIIITKFSFKLIILLNGFKESPKE